MHFEPRVQWQICDAKGRRKYLNEAERQRFIAAADRARPDIRALCYVLALTGCRISEALALTSDHFDEAAGALCFRTLKRRRDAFRSVPIPAELCEILRDLVTEHGGFYWTMHRVTAWRHVKGLLAAVDVDGPMACCRGLRHGFGIKAALRSVPPNLIQRWMGHADATTTAIYLDAVGIEERLFAERMWDSPATKLTKPSKASTTTGF